MYNCYSRANGKLWLEILLLHFSILILYYRLLESNSTFNFVRSFCIKPLGRKRRFTVSKEKR